MTDDTSYSGWAIVEIMGHQRYAGLVGEQVVGGASFIRVDVPECDGHPAFTKLFGGSSIYCITPVAEDIARAAAAKYRKAPVDLYDLPKAWRDAIHEKRQLPPPDPEFDANDCEDDPSSCF